MTKQKIALYFGSFNPIHNGHLAIANYILEYSDLNRLWFVVSPHSPFKNKTSLLPDYQRIELVDLAIENADFFRSSNIEFNLPQPTRTIDTLAYLHEKYPDKEFSLIMGADNLANFHKWKNYRQILDYHNIYVYPRPNSPSNWLEKHKNIKMINAPLIEISSSFIRKAIKEGKDVRFFMPPKVWRLIKEMNYYK